LAAALKMASHCGTAQTADALRELAHLLELHGGAV
jgi:hypothetical protein